MGRLVLFLQLLSTISLGQVLKGKITDLDSKQGVSFAVIIVDNSNYGTTADLDGNFELKLPNNAQSVTIQIIGYLRKTVPLAELDPRGVNIIKLKSDGVKLAEVVVKPKENPAIPIIRKVILNKPKFNIANMQQYICRTYAKTYFTFSDKLGNEAQKNDGLDGDTVSLKMFENSHLFFMESVTEKKYHYKNITQEKVIASRVSGFKSAPFGAFASQLQSFTFYPDKIELLGLSYVNPLSKGTFKRYYFEIMDTVLNQSDTTILIKFYPKKNVKFKALKGVLYINKNQHVLANVLAGPSEADAEGTGILIQQLYERIDSVHWFPKQLNTEVLFRNIGQTDDKVSSILKGVSRLYIKEVNTDSIFKIKHKSIAAFNEPGFDQKKESFWKAERVDSLNEKELKTYRVVDSIGSKLNFDKKLKWFNAFTSAKFQIGYFNIDLDRILRVNDYEGIRLGAGLSTSDKLSRWWTIGGYGGYGFADKALKYGGYARIYFDKRQTVYVSAEAAHEVVETAGVNFLNETRSFFSTESLRNLLVAKMDKVNFGKISFNTPVFNFIRTSFYFQVQHRESPFGFSGTQNNLVVSDLKIFNLNEAGVQFKIWPREKFTESMGKLVSTGSRWPAFFINVAQGITTEVYGHKGNFDYTKLDLRIDHQINFKVKGFVAYQIQAGKVIGDVPYSVQYNNKGSRSDKYPIGVEKTFETMYLNEFISTQYVALFFSLNSGLILKKRKHFNPELELAHNYGIGKLDNRQHLTNIELTDISKGYSEAGLRIKNIYKSNFSSFGLGVFYRYGNYAINGVAKNFAYKLVFAFSL